MVGQERSKWLRDERDVDWGVNHGNINYSQDYQEAVPNDKEINGIFRIDLRMRANSKAIVTGTNFQMGGPKILEAKCNFKSLNGPIEDELTGLNLDERKRIRRPGDNEFMEIEGGNGLSSTKIALSRSDCAASSPEILAKIAMQASQAK